MKAWKNYPESQLNQLEIWKKLYWYQKEALLKLQLKDKSILGFEAGMGKTITSLSWLELHNHFFNVSINWIICSKSKMLEWNEDIVKWGLGKPTLLNGSTFKNLKAIESNTEASPTYIMGYTAFANLWGKGAPGVKDQLMIFDESQKLNGDKSKISKSIINSITKGRINKIMLLSGTLHSTGYQDLGNISIITGLEKNIYSYKNKYLIFQENTFSGIKFKKLIGYKNIDDLIKRLNTVGVLTTSKNILPQRKINEKIINVPQGKEYKIFKKHSVLDFFIADNAATKFQGLRMLASNFIQKRNILQEYEPHKTKTLQELLNDPDLKNERVIIFYNWVFEFQEIKKIMGDRPLSYINGDGQDRKNFIENQNGVIAIQYLSGSEGIDGLQISKNIIYYSPTLSGGLFEQSQRRINRIGQASDQVFYYYLISTGTIEENIYKNLVKYKSYTVKIFGDVNV